ncbi:uncharacterized protein LOC143282374 [Babylonia areolata]|uniref:uncharacterized protein LOC143282374 n=1 Tax=Babylonia areolata TaxID=304850 RepID=UPI003FCFB3A3
MMTHFHVFSSSVMQSTESVVGFTDAFQEATNNATQSSATTLEDFVSSNAECIEISAASLLPCDHPDNLVTKATRLLIQDVVYIGLIPMLTAMGVVVNVVNMFVFVKQGLGDRVRFSLFCLSLADLLALASLYIRHLDKTLAHVISPSWANDVWFKSLIRYRLVAIHAGFQLVSNLISIVIAVDRCVCVTWPLKAARVLSTRVTGLIILVFGVLTFAGMQFVAFKYDVRCVVISGGKTPPFLMVLPSDLYKEMPIVMDILDSFVFSSLIPTLSLLVTAVATIITAVKLKRAAQWRDNSAQGGSTVVMKQKEKALTSMLIVISCIYMACVSPRVIRSLCRFFIPEFRAWGKLCNLMVLTEVLINITLALNSAVNFFVYCAMGSRFRQTMRQLFSCAVTSPKDLSWTENPGTSDYFKDKQSIRK